GAADVADHRSAGWTPSSPNTGHSGEEQGTPRVSARTPGGDRGVQRAISGLRGGKVHWRAVPPHARTVQVLSELHSGEPCGWSGGPWPRDAMLVGQPPG